MYYYRHGEVIFASLLPDLPLEPAKRPSAGTPSLFLIDRDPIRSRSSFCVSDPRQLTAETEDVTWLDPSRMGVPVPSLPKRLQHTIDARLLRAVNIRHPRWADFTKAPAMHLPSRLRVNLLAVGDVGSTLADGAEAPGRRLYREHRHLRPESEDCGPLGHGDGAGILALGLRRPSGSGAGSGRGLVPL